MKVYISGKISGLPMWQVRDKFEQASRQVEAYRYTPANPLHNGCTEDAPWKQQMIHSLDMLMGCDAIYLLRDWEQSRGARIERFMAQEMGLLILEQPDYAAYIPQS